MRDRALVLLEDFDPRSVSIFSTTSPVLCFSLLIPDFNKTVCSQEKMNEEILVKSASDISFFLEEGAVDENGELLCEKPRAVNKIAHGAICCLAMITLL